MDKLNIIGHKLMLIVGILMYIFGSIGNVLNILVFYKWSYPKKCCKRNCNGYRSSNSSLYLLICSIGNLIVIIYPLLTRIIFDGLEYPVTKKNVFILCKLRFYILHTFDLISLTCICMATFDRYIIRSRKVHLRELSLTIDGTKKLILIIICLFSLHNIPIILYFDVSNEGHCLIISKIYFYYYFWVIQIFLRGIFPIIFLTIICLLTLQQLKSLKKVQSKINEKQYSGMLLLISLGIVFSSIPYCIEHIYHLIILNDPIKRSSSLTYFYHIISSILFYTNAVTSFYIFYISTPNFRLQVQKFISWKENPHPIRITILQQNFPK